MLLNTPSTDSRMNNCLWPRAAIGLLAAHIGYRSFQTGSIPIPAADMLLHMAFWGSVGFWLNIFWLDRRVRLFGVAWPLAIVIPTIGFAIVNYFSNAASPDNRITIIWLSSTIGMTFFWWLSRGSLRDSSVTTP